MDIYDIKPHLKYQYIKYRRWEHHLITIYFASVTYFFLVSYFHCMLFDAFKKKMYHFKNCPHHKSYLIPSYFNVSNLESYKPFNRYSSDSSGLRLLKKEILIIYKDALLV